jgi:hypothetical protein
MGLTVVIMLFYFRRKGLLGRQRPLPTPRSDRDEPTGGPPLAEVGRDRRGGSDLTNF